jgi:hypothetical protein
MPDQIATPVLWIGSADLWPSVINGLVRDIHPADLWRSATGKPLTMAEVRHVHEFVGQTPVGAYRFVILEDADGWRPEVANALLKLLEEPPVNTRIVTFSVTDRILPTVRSRLLPRLLDRSAAQLSGRLDVRQPLDREFARQSLYLQSLVHAGHDVERIKAALAS